MLRQSNTEGAMPAQCSPRRRLLWSAHSWLPAFTERMRSTVLQPPTSTRSSPRANKWKKRSAAHAVREHTWRYRAGGAASLHRRLMATEGTCTWTPSMALLHACLLHHTDDRSHTRPLTHLYSQLEAMCFRQQRTRGSAPQGPTLLRNEGHPVFLERPPAVPQTILFCHSFCFCFPLQWYKWVRRTWNSAVLDFELPWTRAAIA